MGPSDEDLEEFHKALEDMDDMDVFNQAHECYNQGQMGKAFLYFHYTAMKETTFRVYRADALYYLAYILQQTDPDRALKYLDLSVSIVKQAFHSDFICFAVITVIVLIRSG